MNLNRSACEIVREMVARSEELGVEVRRAGGATLIDCGVRVPGSFAAGAMFAEACMGGLGRVRVSMHDYGFGMLPVVEVEVRKPAIACLGSQKAGWKLAEGDFFSLGSGPARILARKPASTYRALGYEEESDVAVIALEAPAPPPEKLVEEIARECGVEQENLYILLAPTASIAGSLQVSARVVETALYRAMHLNMDVNAVRSALGRAPVAPVVGGDAAMMGVTNDMIIYGGEVYLVAEGFEASKLVSSSSTSYGKPFAEVFREAGYDFYRVDPAIFAPARVTVNQPESGEMSTAGKLNVEVLMRSAGMLR